MSGGRRRTTSGGHRTTEGQGGCACVSTAVVFMYGCRTMANGYIDRTVHGRLVGNAFFLMSWIRDNPLFRKLRTTGTLTESGAK